MEFRILGFVCFSFFLIFYFLFFQVSCSVSCLWLYHYGIELLMSSPDNKQALQEHKRCLLEGQRLNLATLNLLSPRLTASKTNHTKRTFTTQIAQTLQSCCSQ